MEADGDAGEILRYSYASNGHLETVSDASGVLYRFEYAPLLNASGFDPWLLTAVLDRDWKVLLQNKYLWGRISEQRLADGQVVRYEYQLNGTEVERCTVTLPSGETKVFSFRDGKPVLK